MRTVSSKRSRPSHKKRNLLLVLIVLVLIFAVIKHSHQDKTGTLPADSSVAGSTQSFNKKQYSINDPNSIWVVVNKGRILPSTYAPADLVVPNVPLRLSAGSPEMHMRQVTATAMEKMFQKAATQNIHLMVASAYRSYDEQIGLYNGYVRTQGQTAADASSARAGHSEHQTGLTADLEPASRNCEVEQCFGDTAEGKWLAANAYKYGFIIRYPKGQDKLTGYEYEPWHVRYVGVDLAKQIHKTGQTLEQFFGLPAYADYPGTSYQLAAGK